MANSSNSNSFHIDKSPSWSSPFPSPVSLDFIYILIIELNVFIFVHVNFYKKVTKFAGFLHRIEFRCGKYSTNSKTSKYIIKISIPQ